MEEEAFEGVLQNVEFGCAEVVVGRQGKFNDRKIEQGVEYQG